MHKTTNFTAECINELLMIAMKEVDTEENWLPALQNPGDQSNETPNDLPI